MDTNVTLYEIVAGPCRDLLFDACKYAYSPSTRIFVDFTIAVGYTRPRDESGSACIPMKIDDIQITDIQHEDGSGYSFNLKGFCKANLSATGNHYGHYKFKAYYETRYRRGSISFSEC